MSSSPKLYGGPEKYHIFDSIGGRFQNSLGVIFNEIDSQSGQTMECQLLGDRPDYWYRGNDNPSHIDLGYYFENVDNWAIRIRKRTKEVKENTPQLIEVAEFDLFGVDTLEGSKKGTVVLFTDQNATSTTWNQEFAPFCLVCLPDATKGMLYHLVTFPKEELKKFLDLGGTWEQFLKRPNLLKTIHEAEQNNQRSPLDDSFSNPTLGVRGAGLLFTHLLSIVAENRQSATTTNLTIQIGKLIVEKREFKSISKKTGGFV